MTLPGGSASTRSLPPRPIPEWTLRDAPEPDVVDHLQEELGLPPRFCELLAVRGLTDSDEARQHLRPLPDRLHDACRLRDAEALATRLAQAVKTGDVVLVHGDYDVDGITATALVVGWIRALGGKAVPFIPHRLRDGYDLGSAGLEAAVAAGARVLFTADCGTTATDAVARARAAGLEVLVTDHHTPGPTLPDAACVVNPQRPDCSYPEPRLCGAAVAWKVCQLLADQVGASRRELEAQLDLVALATIADLVPLEGENRVLAHLGLRVMAAAPRPGLAALMDVADVDPEGLDAGAVGFRLAPRLNAAGRLGEADAALDLLLTRDPRRAHRLARHLDELNQRRQEEDERILQEAEAQLARDFDPQRDHGVVLAEEGWHPGVVGIAASRIVERIHRPAVLVALDGDQGRGSARSVAGVDLYRAVSRAGEHLERYGGHRQAAGMDLRRESVEPFRQAFNEAVRQETGGDPPKPKLRADLELPLKEAEGELFRLLRYLGPFGIANPRPVFVARGVRPAGPARAVGRGHLKVELTDGEVRLDAIGFDLAQRIPPERINGGSLDVAFQLAENRYRGECRLQARLLDLRPAGHAG